MFSPSKLSDSPRLKLIEHVEPDGPRAGLHDQRDVKSPSCVKKHRNEIDCFQPKLGAIGNYYTKKKNIITTLTESSHNFDGIVVVIAWYGQSLN